MPLRMMLLWKSNKEQQQKTPSAASADAAQSEANPQPPSPISAAPVMAASTSAAAAAASVVSAADETTASVPTAAAHRHAAGAQQADDNARATTSATTEHETPPDSAPPLTLLRLPGARLSSTPSSAAASVASSNAAGGGGHLRERRLTSRKGGGTLQPPPPPPHAAAACGHSPTRSALGAGVARRSLSTTTADSGVASPSSDYSLGTSTNSSESHGTTSSKSRIFPSTRFLIALLLCLCYTALSISTSNISVGIVCMVKRQQQHNAANSQQPSPPPPPPSAPSLAQREHSPPPSALLLHKTTTTTTISDAAAAAADASSGAAQPASDASSNDDDDDGGDERRPMRPDRHRLLDAFGDVLDIGGDDQHQPRSRPRPDGARWALRRKRRHANAVAAASMMTETAASEPPTIGDGGGAANRSETLSTKSLSPPSAFALAHHHVRGGNSTTIGGAELVALTRSNNHQPQQHLSGCEVANRIKKHILAGEEVPHQISSHDLDVLIESCHDAERLQWSSTDQGLVFAAQNAGSLLMLFTGTHADRLNSKWTIVVALAFLVISNSAVPLVAGVSIWPVVAARLMTGFADALLQPSTSSLITRWFPPKERPFAIGLITGGRQIGTLLILPVAGFLCSRHDIMRGWPAIFYLSALISAVVLLVWLLCAADKPAKHCCTSVAERYFIEQKIAEEKLGKRTDRKRVPWRRLTTCVPLHVAVFALICHEYPLVIMLQLLPIYINDVLKISTLANGIVSALPIAVLFLSKTISSSLSSIIQARKQSRWCRVGRTPLVKIFNGIASLGLGVSVGIVPLFNSPEQKVPAIIVLCLANAFAGLHTPGVQTALLQLAPAYTGIVTGIAFGFVGIFGIINKILNNWIASEGTVSEWTLVFAISAVVALLPVLIFSVWGSADRQPWATNHQKKRYSIASSIASTNYCCRCYSSSSSSSMGGGGHSRRTSFQPPLADQTQPSPSSSSQTAQLQHAHPRHLSVPAMSSGKLSTVSILSATTTTNASSVWCGCPCHHQQPTRTISFAATTTNSSELGHSSDDGGACSAPSSPLSAPRTPAASVASSALRSPRAMTPTLSPTAHGHSAFSTPTLPAKKLSCAGLSLAFYPPPGLGFVVIDGFGDENGCGDRRSGAVDSADDERDEAASSSSSDDDDDDENNQEQAIASALRLQMFLGDCNSTPPSPSHSLKSARSANGSMSGGAFEHRKPSMMDGLANALIPAACSMVPSLMLASAQTPEPLSPFADHLLRANTAANAQSPSVRTSKASFAAVSARSSAKQQRRLSMPKELDLFGGGMRAPQQRLDAVPEMDTPVATTDVVDTLSMAAADDATLKPEGVLSSTLSRNDGSLLKKRHSLVVTFPSSVEEKREEEEEQQQQPSSSSVGDDDEAESSKLTSKRRTMSDEEATKKVVVGQRQQNVDAQTSADANAEKRFSSAINVDAEMPTNGSDNGVNRSKSELRKSEKAIVTSSIHGGDIVEGSASCDPHEHPQNMRENDEKNDECSAQRAATPPLTNDENEHHSGGGSGHRQQRASTRKYGMVVVFDDVDRGDAVEPSRRETKND